MAAVALIVIASLLVPLTIEAIWAKRTVLDTGRFTSTVSDVALDKEVTDVIAARITKEVFSILETSPIVQDLPAALEPVRNIIVGAVETRVQSAVADVLSSDTFDTLFRTAVADAHRAALDVLEGNGNLPGDYFSVDDATITIDMRQMMLAVFRELQQDGVIPASVDLPQPGDPPGRLATALGVDIPEDFGQVVVYRTDDVAVDDTLNTAQRVLVIIQRGVVAVAIFTLVVLAGAVAIATDRRKAVFRLGIGIAVVTAVHLLLLRRVEKAIPDRTTTAGARAVAEALGSTINASLGRALLILFAVGVLTAVFARYWEPILRWVGAHADLANIGVALIGIGFLWVAGLTWITFLVALLIVGAGLLLVRSAKRRPELPRSSPDIGAKLPA
jgi:hypothetical protein